MSKKSKRRSNDDDTPEFDKPKSDAYVGLLAISLIALIAGAVLLYVDFDELQKAQAPVPTITVSEDGLAMPKGGVPKG
ncbi:hypothetical protein BH11PLA2_BH11PLA2_21430 [soil metagenome]